MNDVNLNKPITIVRAEFISNLTNLINKSALPPFIIESILKDAYVEVKAVAQRQYESDVKKYEELKINKNNSVDFPAEEHSIS